jgi:hypothetical protein
MSQPIALFVSEQKLKAFTSVNQNVSPTELVPFLLQSQDIYLQTFIGATFYYQLKHQVLTGQVTPENQFLLDEFMQRAILNWGLMLALPFLKYKIYNKSVLSPTSENAESITLEELKFLQAQLEDVAQSYMKRCIEWCVLHPGDYPAYISPNVQEGQLPQRGNPYSTGLVTPKSPYAWKKRVLINNRDLGNVGYYNNDGFCGDCGVPNSVSPRNV